MAQSLVSRLNTALDKDEKDFHGHKFYGLFNELIATSQGRADLAAALPALFETARTHLEKNGPPGQNSRSRFSTIVMDAKRVDECHDAIIEALPGIMRMALKVGDDSTIANLFSEMGTNDKLFSKVQDEVVEMGLLRALEIFDPHDQRGSGIGRGLLVILKGETWKARSDLAFKHIAKRPGSNGQPLYPQQLDA
jgi:hypothetical protein